MTGSPRSGCPRRDAGSLGIFFFSLLVLLFGDRYTKKRGFLGGVGVDDFILHGRHGRTEEPQKEKEDPPLLSRGAALRSLVVEDLEKNPLHQGEEGTAALAIARAMKEGWWEKRQDQAPWEVVRELYEYNKERKAREARKARRAEGPPTAAPEPERAGVASVPRRRSGFSGGRSSTRTTRQETPAEEVSSVVQLSITVGADVRTVLEKAAAYLAQPGSRPVSPFRAPALKKSEALSERSRVDYERGMNQVKKDIKNLGLSTGWDMCAYLVQVAQDATASTYRRRRALVLRLVEEKSPATAALIRALPHYGELCAMLGRRPSPRSSAVTEARRAPQREKQWQQLLRHLSPEHRDALLALRYTGARSCEAESLALSLEEDEGVAVVRVSISSAKTGARRTPGSSVRTWTVPTSTPEGTILQGLLERRGPHPAPYSPDALRSAWRRARLQEGLEKDPGWDLHSLRHQFAGDEKKKVALEMRRTHGYDWRRKLFGKRWQDSEAYKEAFYGPVAQRLGHTCKDATKIYG